METRYPPPQPPRPSFFSYWLDRGLSWFYGITFFVVASGLFVRLTIQDTVKGFSTVFYATPLPILVGGVLVLLLIDWRRGDRRWAIGWAVAFGVLGTWCYQQNWRWGPKLTAAAEVQPGTIDVLFWNVARKENLRPVVDYIQESKPDLIGLVEVSGTPEERRAYFEKHLPDYDLSTVGGMMHVLVRGSSGKARATDLDTGSYLRQLRVTIDGNEIECFIADIGAYVLRSREQALDRLAEATSKAKDSPILLFGDFNTPTDSEHYVALRKQLQLTFETAGRGYAPTWPVPLPVLQLDQIWVNDRIEVLQCTHGFTFDSDHRPVHATIRVRPTP